MRHLHILGAVFLSLVSFLFASAQSKSQIETKYGPPIKAYPVSENIWMTPEFTPDGRLCMARLYPKQIDANTNYIQGRLWLSEIKDVLDELAPVTTRGKRTADLGTLLIGNTVFQGVVYENLRVNFVSAWGSTKETKETDAPEFAGIDRPHIVTLTWTGRTCANR